MQSRLDVGIVDDPVCIEYPLAVGQVLDDASGMRRQPVDVQVERRGESLDARFCVSTRGGGAGVALLNHCSGFCRELQSALLGSDRVVDDRIVSALDGAISGGERSGLNGFRLKPGKLFLEPEYIRLYQCQRFVDLINELNFLGGHIVHHFLDLPLGPAHAPHQLGLVRFVAQVKRNADQVAADDGAIDAGNLHAVQHRRAHSLGH